jgi:biopolymer transport protein ExbD
VARRVRRRHTDEQGDIDLTPMLDVVFIMLIFFIVTATFTKESGIDINRPQAQTAEKKERAGIMVAINDRDQIFIQRRQVDVRAVRANIERLIAESPKSGVVIQADKLSRTGILVEVMDQIRMAGVENVSVAAKKPKQ